MRKIVAGVAVLAAAGCGGSSHAGAADPTPAAGATSSSAGPTRAQMAATYLRLVKPSNDASDEFQSKASALGDNPSAAAVQKIADPVIAADRKWDEALLRASWTPEVYTDIKGLVAADRQVEAALGNIGDQNTFSVSAWEQQITQAGAAVSSAVSIVRADLGLPPAS